MQVCRFYKHQVPVEPEKEFADHSLRSCVQPGSFMLAFNRSVGPGLAIYLGMMSRANN
jgi:hypothetical protein